MEVLTTSLPGLLVIQPRVFADARGFFLETWRTASYSTFGIPPMVQDNLSRSSRGTLRGLHYQLKHPQGKFVQVCRGEVFDVAVDLRRNSPTFGKWEGVVLSDENHRQMYIPPGFAHGFCVLSETADFFYKCTEYYHPEDERAILWNDPGIGIEWPDEMPKLLSKKDEMARAFEDSEYFD